MQLSPPLLLLLLLLHSLSFSLLLTFSLLHVTSARPTPFTLDDDTSSLLNHTSATWHDFTRFIHVKKGANITGLFQLKKYFHRFGYLQSQVNFTDTFDSSLQSALLQYQTKLGLPVTGDFDPETINLIMSPRCGLSDYHTRATTTATPLLHLTQHYTFFDGRPRWTRPTPMNLTYALSETDVIDYVSRDDIRAAFSRAFAQWAKVIPINFTEINEFQNADIKIGFFSGDHGDGEPFDGRLGVLAHAFSPESGRLHLDGDEIWAVDFSKERSTDAVDLESVVTHEIGHVLGLAHSSVHDAIMYPSLKPRSKKSELRVDDVEGVQALYGSNPDFKFSSLYESEETSNGWMLGLLWLRCWAIGLVLVHHLILTL